jgi:hypothetical protein
MNKIHATTIRELRVGDQIVDKGRDVYKVIEIVRDEPDERILRVRWADGGHDLRAWDSEAFDHVLLVIREEGGA